MPTISRFFGIVIRMYHRDHGPPHFHACHGEFEAQLEIGTRLALRGTLPKRALARVRDWAEAHRAELEENWIRAERHEPLLPITPLEQV